MRLWYLSHRRPAKAQVSLCICTVMPEPSLFAHMKYGSRRRVRPNIRHLAPLDCCACVFERMSLRRMKSAIVSWDGSINPLKPHWANFSMCPNFFRFLLDFFSIGRHSKSLDTEKKVCGYCHGRFELMQNSGSLSNSGADPTMTPKTPRTPNRFALYVKEHYSTVKKRDKNLKHGDVMKELSKQFAEMNKIWDEYVALKPCGLNRLNGKGKHEILLLRTWKRHKQRGKQTNWLLKVNIGNIIYLFFPNEEAVWNFELLPI